MRTSSIRHEPAAERRSTAGGVSRADRPPLWGNRSASLTADEVAGAIAPICGNASARARSGRRARLPRSGWPLARPLPCRFRARHGRPPS